MQGAKRVRKSMKMFGLDIWCDYREDYQMIDNADDTVKGEPNSDGEGGAVE